MTGWFEVATVAFVAQLLVLPGEKGQLIVAGLSTRYNPLLVAGAAGSAFAGWTVLEILLGTYLHDALPPLVLEVLTGAMFLAFAVVLYRSAPGDGPAPSDGTEPSDAQSPATDGGVITAADGSLDVRVPYVGWTVPDALRGFVPIFALMAFGEFGDKTQLITIGLAANYAAPTAIWVGEMAAILPVTLANAYVFHRFSGRFDRRRAHLFSAALFAAFGVDTLQATVTGVSVWETAVTGLGDALVALA